MTGDLIAQPSEPLLAPREQEILRSLLDAVIPDNSRLPRPRAEIEERYHLYLALLPESVRSTMTSMLWALEIGAAARYFKPFTRLDQAQQQQYLYWLYDKVYPTHVAIRALLFGLKYAYFSAPTVKSYLGHRLRVETSSEPLPRYMQERMISTRDWTPGEPIEADVVVIGTGAGGAVVAKELAQRGHAVVMLESGRYHGRQHFNGDPLEMTKRMYRGNGMVITVGNSPIVLPLGHTVGGTTAINSGTCYRTPDKVLQHWASDLGLRELGPEQMGGYFERVESMLGVVEAQTKYLGGTARKIAIGAEMLGLKHGPLRRNAADCDGQGLCCHGCPTDAKRSTNVSYVPAALKHGAMLVTEARVDEFLIRGDRVEGVVARGVDATDQPYRLEVRAPIVVVACGSIYTPLLLMRNGLCSTSHQLGRNLTIHPAYNAFALFDEDLGDQLAIPQGYAIEEFKEQGILYEGGTAPIGITAGGLSMIGPRFAEVMSRARGLGNFGFMICDTSRGSVIEGPNGAPLISYYLNRRDVERIRFGLDILARVYFAAGAEAVLPNIFGIQELRGEADLEMLKRVDLQARHLQLTAHHPLGTARMGHHPTTSVVTHEHETHDIRNLYIVDGSVVPTPLGVNPQITIMSMATRAAEKISERLEQLHH
ncbi:MAG: GMC family oxidoreductase [Myxococcales bacterium]|nr:GMC family oxidoreductase [Myxococcales bacterium]